MSSKFVFTKDFPAGETFEAIHAAEQWLASIGCSYGSMQEDRPILVARGEWPHPGRWKWRHFDAAEVAMFDGQIEPIGDFRNGGARVKLRFQP